MTDVMIDIPDSPGEVTLKRLISIFGDMRISRTPKTIQATAAKLPGELERGSFEKPEPRAICTQSRMVPSGGQSGSRTACASESPIGGVIFRPDMQSEEYRSPMIGLFPGAIADLASLHAFGSW